MQVVKDGVVADERIKLADPADLTPRQLDGAMARLGLHRYDYDWPHLPRARPKKRMER